MRTRFYAAAIAAWAAGVILAIGAPAPIAHATYSDPTLDGVASAIAHRPVTVNCATEEEDPILITAWGYVWVPTSAQKETTIHEKLCRGMLAIASDSPDISDYYKALGADVITHEAFHLRRVRGNENEAVTECRAMQHYDQTLIALGATSAVIARLMPLMLINHFRLRAKYDEYNRRVCKVPRRYNRYIGFPDRSDG